MIPAQLPQTRFLTFPEKQKGERIAGTEKRGLAVSSDQRPWDISKKITFHKQATSLLLHSLGHRTSIRIFYVRPAMSIGARALTAHLGSLCWFMLLLCQVASHKNPQPPENLPRMDGKVLMPPSKSLVTGNLALLIAQSDLLRTGISHKLTLPGDFRGLCEMSFVILDFFLTNMSSQHKTTISFCHLQINMQTWYWKV